VWPKNFLHVNLVQPWFCPYFLQEKYFNIKTASTTPIFPYNYVGATMQFRGAEILGAWLVRFCMVAPNIFSKINAVLFLT
jgi:hypothetical protein